MGVEVGFYTLPRLSEDITFDTAYATFKKASFDQELLNSWHQEQIKNGYEFKFECDYSWINTACISDDPDIYEFYKNYKLAEVEDCVDYWCSASRLFDSDIKTFMEKSEHNGIYVVTAETIDSIIKYCNEWLETHELEPVQPKFAYKYNEDDSITMIPLDGIEVQFDDGTTKRFDVGDCWESGIYASREYCDSEDIFTIKRLQECMYKCKELLVDNFIYYIS